MLLHVNSYKYFEDPVSVCENLSVIFNRDSIPGPYYLGYSTGNNYNFTKKNHVQKQKSNDRYSSPLFFLIVSGRLKLKERRLTPKFVDKLWQISVG